MVKEDLRKQIDLHSFNIFAEIAYECLDEERSRRPNIDDIVPRLKKALELARENRLIHSCPNHLAHLRIPIEDFLSATRGSLSSRYEENVDYIKGAFGRIYEGQLSWCGELIEITIKRLINKEWDEKELQFWTEISMLSSLKHKNIVSLIGFCNEVGAETIIYKDVFRGMLINYLNKPMLLTWVKRLEVSVGVAHALSYIHYDKPRDFSVIHRNISSYTILLNDDLEPKLSEFQHSMKIEASEKTNIVNNKSDVYSFGVVLFELLCGRKSVINDQDNKYLAPVAIFHYREKILDDIIDPYLLKQMDRRSLNIFAETAYECLSEEQSHSQYMDKIATRLDEALKLQLECKNAAHSSVVDEAGGTSSSHEEGSVTFVSRGNESQVSKNTKSFLKDLSHLKLSWEDFFSATNNFDEESFLNKDKMIFKGRLLHSEQFIDIFGKVYRHDKGENKMLWMELRMLSSLKHKNLVSLIGFLVEEAEEEVNVIIYKKEENGSLEKFLSDQALTWMQRLKICVGVANALSYIYIMMLDEILVSYIATLGAQKFY